MDKVDKGLGSINSSLRQPRPALEPGAPGRPLGLADPLRQSGSALDGGTDPALCRPVGLGCTLRQRRAPLGTGSHRALYRPPAARHLRPLWERLQRQDIIDLMDQAPVPPVPSPEKFNDSDAKKFLDDLF